MAETATVPPVTPPTEALVRIADDTVSGFASAGAFELLQRGARLLSESSLVPKEYQKSIPNCVIALNLAQRIGADPLMVMQNLYIVHGRPGWSAQFLIATFNQNGRFTALRYEWVGEDGADTRGCRAWAIEKSTGERLTGATITVALAKAEGWFSKSGSKWQTMPEQMLMYRSAAWFIRAYAPEIAMGLHTVDEIDDSVIDAVRTPSGYVMPPTIVTPESLIGAHTTGENGVEPGLAPKTEETTPPVESTPDDPRAEFLAAIAVAREAVKPPLDDEAFKRLVVNVTTVTTLEQADPALLSDLLNLLRAYVKGEAPAKKLVDAARKAGK